MKSDLAARKVKSKDIVQMIFQKYSKDIEEVQQHFERFKSFPKMPRNAPPVAGRILWARQLLMQIEVPMNECVP